MMGSLGLPAAAGFITMITCTSMIIISQKRQIGWRSVMQSIDSRVGVATTGGRYGGSVTALQTMLRQRLPH